MANEEFRFPTWSKYLSETREKDLIPVNRFTEAVLLQHQTDLVFKGSVGFEQNLTDLAWFLADPFKHYESLEQALQEVEEIRETEGKIFDLLKQVTVLLRYDGPRQVIDVRSQVGQDLLPNLVDGALLSRPTGALSRDFLAECLERRKKQAPEKVYNELIDSQNPLLFKSRYYSEHIYDANLPATAGFLIHFEVLGSLQGLGLSQPLIKGMLRYYRSKGLDYAFAFARLIGMQHKFFGEDEAALDLQKYVQRGDGRGLHPDPTVRAHQKAGGQIIAGLPDCRYDPPSFNNGVFVIYDLKELESRGKLKL